MKTAAIERLLLLPFTSPVRRGSLLAGVVSAIPTGGFPFIGLGPPTAMGRVVPLISPAGFVLHLLLAVIYGAILSLAIGRSRGWWTLAAAAIATLLLYIGDLWLMRAWGFPFIAPESRAAAAHLLFGLVFTIFFKLRQADPTGLSAA